MNNIVRMEPKAKSHKGSSYSAPAQLIPYKQFRTKQLKHIQLKAWMQEAIHFTEAGNKSEAIICLQQVYLLAKELGKKDTAELAEFGLKLWEER